MKSDTILHMKLSGQNDRPITNFEEWKEFAPSRAEHHWAAGRSACELASLWCGPGMPTMPDALREVLEAIEGTRNIVFGVGKPEYRIRFDQRRGGPQNADMAFVYYTATSRVAVTIEAKADEPFGPTVAQTLAAARNRAALNDRSQGVERTNDLISALFSPRTAEESEIRDVRYHLLTAVARSIAYARNEGAAKAVMVVHEFKTTKTKDHLHARNADDFAGFLRNLSGTHERGQSAPAVWGPFMIPGAPLFANVPPLFVAKVVTERTDVSLDPYLQNRTSASLRHDP